MFAEKLIGKKAKIKNYLGKGYAVECLPEYYEHIIGYLESKLGYVDCCADEDVEFDIDDNAHGNKIIVTKVNKNIIRSQFK